MAILRYLGISFVEIVMDDSRVVLVDPCISINPFCPITLESLGRADLVLLTHMASDHSSDIIPVLKKTGAQRTLHPDTPASVPT